MESNKEQWNLSSNPAKKILVDGPEKFNYEGLDTTSPIRFDGESFIEYKTRMKIVNYVMKQRLKGKVIHQSRQHIYDKPEEQGGKFIGLGKGLTYVKPKE